MPALDRVRLLMSPSGPRKFLVTPETGRGAGSQSVVRSPPFQPNVIRGQPNLILKGPPSLVPCPPCLAMPSHALERLHASEIMSNILFSTFRSRNVGGGGGMLVSGHTSGMYALMLAESHVLPVGVG